MEYKEYITPEMQKKWFNKINNDNNYYFIIVLGNKEIGLINVRDINYEKLEGEGGIFIYDDELLHSDAPFRASCCLNEFVFNTLKLKRVIAHILKENKRAIKYNEFMGFRKADKQENITNQLYYLDFDNYTQKRKLFINLLQN